jgi:hypothetical protein
MTRIAPYLIAALALVPAGQAKSLECGGVGTGFLQR